MSNTITAYFKGRIGVAEAVYQNDYGIVMAFDSIDLPAHFDCYFSRLNQEEALPGVGADSRVAIPNSILADPGNVTVHVPLHTGENDSEVEYVVYFKVIGRARPIDDGTPVQMTAIERALALLSQPITNIEEIVNEALSFTGDTFAEMKQELQDDFDNYTETLEGDLATWKSGVESDFDNLEAQFDTAVAAVTTDTEVTNIRVGDDNVIYTTAGDAVRKQFSDVKAEIDYTQTELGEPDDYHTTNMINENALTQSKMIADDGSITNAPDNTWYVTDFLDVGHEEYLYLTLKSTTIYLLFCYDENQNPIGERITSSSSRLTSHTTYYDVHLYKGTKYVRANMRTAWMGSYMLTKYFYPSTYVAAGTYKTRNPSEFTVAAKAQLAYNTYRTDSGIVRTYYSSWNAQLSGGVFSLLDMPQNTITYVNLSEIQPTQIAGLPFTSGAVYLEKIGKGTFSIYRMYRNQLPWQAIGYYNGTSFVWFSSTNWQNIKIGMLGDSVTEGRIGGQSGITDKGIPYWVGYETGLPVVNLGVGNMGWASHQYLTTNAYEYLQTLDLSSYKVLTFQYGLNDGDIPLGTYTDTTTDTIMGSVYKCLEYVYSQNPTVQVIMINPTVGSKPDAFPYFNPNAHHSASDRWTFTEYFEQMKLFCDKYAIPLIDGWKGLNAWNRETLIGDNVHPTVAGYEVVGRYIAGQIKSMI